MDGPTQSSRHAEPPRLRACFLVPIPEIGEAAGYLDEAVSAHLAGKGTDAEELIKRANIDAIREWTESIWGKASPHITPRDALTATLCVQPVALDRIRVATAAHKTKLHLRDGYHCRFCGIPLIRKEVRDQLRKLYPDALVWGSKNATQHAAFQAMWAQYDHIVPHARGGRTDLANMVVTCAPCNFGRMNHTLEEVGLLDPLMREPIRSGWDGLERLLSRRCLSIVR